MRFFETLFNSPTFMTWGNFFARTSGLFLLLPLVLTRFSEQDIVVWYILASSMSLQMLMDFGFIPTFTRHVSYAYGGLDVTAFASVNTKRVRASHANWRSIFSVYEAMKYAYRIIAVLAFFLVATLGTCLVGDVFNKSDQVLPAWVSWFLVITIASVSLYGNSYVALLEGLNKVAVVHKWKMIFSAMATLVSAFVLWFDGELLAVVAAFYMWHVANVLVNRRLKNLALQEAGCSKPAISSLETRQLVKTVIWPNAWKSGVGVSTSLGLIQFSNVLVAKFSATGTAASYMISLQFIHAVRSFSCAPLYAKLPELNKLYVQEHGMHALRCIAEKGITFSYLAFVVPFFVVGIFSESLLEMIGANVKFPSIQFWVLLGFAFLVERLGAMNLQIYTLTGDVIWHVANGITGILMILMAVVLYPVINIYAMPMAMLVAYSLFYAPYVLTKVVSEFPLLAKTQTFFAFLCFFIFSFLLLTFRSNINIGK